MNKTFFSILLLFSFFGSAEIVDTGHARISLIKDHSDFVPGTSINIGLKVSMDKGWHTYWRNPGDSGGPIEIEWDLPKGFSVSDIKWPLPEKIEYPPLMTYGYEDFVIYPMVLSIPDDYSNDYFEMAADILICADVCIPESGKISSNLLDIESDSLIYEWLESIPSKSLPITTSLNDNNLEIRFTFEKEIKEIYFFPDENNSIDYSSKQNFYKKDDDYFLSIKLFNDEFQNISGVLDIDGTGYNVSNGTFENFNEEGLSLITALIFALIGGLILNLMPCVFPVISLKVLSFVSMGGSSPRKIRNHALVFTVGVISSFMLIALIIVLFKQAGNFVGWGFQLQSPLIVGLLSLVMVFISLVLVTDNSFGESLTKLGNIGGSENGYYSSFLTGVLAVVVASPCTAPFMGAALGYALIKPSGETVPIFLSLSLGFSLPYLLLAANPKLIDFLPKPGDWMVTLKEFFAFPMLATALWLLWVFSLQVNQILVIFLLIGWLLLALNFWIFQKDYKTINKVIFLGISIFSMIYFLPETEDIETEQNLIIGSATEWYEGIEDDLRNKNQPYFINFTAAWCITCQSNEITAFSKDGFKSLLEEKNIEYIKADWTNRNDAITRSLKKYGRSGVPFYVYWEPGFENPKILPAILTDQIIKNNL
ncbi:protein-disulfide reductase DsbD family protein [Pseudomonadota bacterium]|nr:protein-disulfide reductase DsbD family protein [Pseudomonadota bacterium]